MVQKYHVIFASGNPQPSGFGTATDATKVDLVNGIAAKAANIQTFVVLIGVNGVNFIKETYSPLVEDPSKDIIVVDPNNPAPAYLLLSKRLCKPNGYDVRITEVRTDTETNTGTPRFVEVLNRGATANIRLII